MDAGADTKGIRLALGSAGFPAGRKAGKGCVFPTDHVLRSMYGGYIRLCRTRMTWTVTESQEYKHRSTNRPAGFLDTEKGVCESVENSSIPRNSKRSPEMG